MLKKITHPGMLILIGFVCMILFIMGIFLSVDTDDFQLVTDNYYEKEQYYQEELDALSRAELLGNTLEMKLSGDSLKFSLPESLYLDVDTAFVKFYHVSDSKEDHSYAIATEQSRESSIPCDFVRGKNYEISLSFTADGQKYLRKIKSR